MDAKSMDDNSETERIATSLTCTRCQKLFVDPVMLPCCHAFCASCIDGMAAGETESSVEPAGNIKCTVCGSVSDVTDVKKSVMLRELLHVYRKLQLPEGATRRKCDACDDDAHWRCEECKTFYCNSCHSNHAADDTTRYHVTSPAGVDESLLVDRPVFCDAHNKRMHMNCQQCQTLVCSTCLSSHDGGHVGHETETVGEASERLKPIYEQYALALQEDLAILQQEVAHLEKLEAKATDAAERQTIEESIAKKKTTMAIYSSLQEWIMLVLSRSCDEFKVHELQTSVKRHLLTHYYYENEASTGDSNQSSATDDDVAEMVTSLKAALKERSSDAQSTEIEQVATTRYGIPSYSQLFNSSRNTWLMRCQMQVPADNCTRINVVNGQMWLPVREADEILVLSKDNGKQLMTISLPDLTHPTAVQQVNRDCIVLTADTGVFRLDADGSIVETLHTSGHVDVQTESESQFLCLDTNSRKVNIFQFKHTADDDNARWQVIKSVNLRTEKSLKPHTFTSAFLLDGTVFASGSCTSTKSGRLHEYNPTTEPSQRYVHETCERVFYRPVVCGIDAEGALLVADTWQHKVFFVLPNGAVKTVKLNHQRVVHGPKDLLFVNENTLWVMVEQGLGSTLLIKYTHSDCDEMSPKPTKKKCRKAVRTTRKKSAKPEVEFSAKTDQSYAVISAKKNTESSQSAGVTSSAPRQFSSANPYSGYSQPNAAAYQQYLQQSVSAYPFLQHITNSYPYQTAATRAPSSTWSQAAATSQSTASPWSRYGAQTEQE